MVIVQFLKGGNSGEIPLLAKLGAEIYRGKAGQKFVFQMNEAEKAVTRELQNRNLQNAMARPCRSAGLGRGRFGLGAGHGGQGTAPKGGAGAPAARECVLTAHQPPQWMLDEADYVTEMKCHRHPYQKGVPARKGIEY